MSLLFLQLEECAAEKALLQTSSESFWYPDVIMTVGSFSSQIMKEYKSEIDDILLSNKQLARELEFDMRQLERLQAAATKSTPKGALYHFSR